MKNTRVEDLVTSISNDVFCLTNLPEVVKGALFSKYSRTKKSIKQLLAEEYGEEQASDFYDRILDGYGDDSIGELGGAHLALENISMLAAKEIQDCRIGGSPLEKSTRYIEFDDKVDGKYRYIREPMLMQSNGADLYEDTCDMLFSTYTALKGPLMAYLNEQYPYQGEGSKRAYSASMKARALDSLRGLLPASTTTNMGVYGNGRFFEGLCTKLHASELRECQDLAPHVHEQLSQVIPSFVRKGDKEHRHTKAHLKYLKSVRYALKYYCPIGRTETESNVRLVDYDPDAPFKVAAALRYENSSSTLDDLRPAHTLHCRDILRASVTGRTNRRHKSPRGLEVANYTFEITSDFGCYRDLQRHRILTQGRQTLTPKHGYSVPADIEAAGLTDQFVMAMEKARMSYYTLSELCPKAAQYVVPMGFRVRWYVHMNLRALQWLCELRSQPQGHIGYRRTAQDLVRRVVEVHPDFKLFFRFMEYDDGGLGRLDQEQRSAERRTKKEILNGPGTQTP